MTPSSSVPPRGYTLVDLMVAVAVLAIIASMNPFFGYQRATTEALKIEGLMRVLDVEMERARSCTEMDCIAKLATTTTGVSSEADSWVRARVQRSYRPGPDGTVEFTVSASALGSTHIQELRALLRVER
ncbi:MAG: type II secretion system protein [Deltaproteobacteria bacterium]|nr:type II secretion system protein [Deltaproteobacteria bacterium]